MNTSCPAVDAVLLQKTESTITPETLRFPGYIQILKNVLSPDECQELINATEAHGFKRASLYTDIFGKEYFSDTRKSERCIVDSPQFVAALESRLRPYLPTEFRSGKLKGINERLRFLKYTAGDEFKPHKDGKTIDTDGSASKLSLLIYLNDNYAGGQTEFMNNDLEWAPIVPETGMVVLYDQTLTHRVPPLTGGCKYVIRSELMYIESSKDEYKMFTIS
jgi:hypothetical protein